MNQERDLIKFEHIDQFLEPSRDAVLFLGPTAIKKVGGIESLAIASYVLARQDGRFGVGMYWGKPADLSGGARTLAFDPEKKKPTFHNSWWAMQTITRAGHADYDFATASLAFIKGRYDSHGQPEEWEQLVRTPGTKMFQGESLEGDYLDISPVNRLILALGGSRGADQVFREVRQSAPSGEEVKLAQERAARVGIALNLGQ